MINNINTLQNLPESSGLSTYTDLYLKQSLANLGQRFSIKGDGLNTGEFSISDILDIDYNKDEHSYSYAHINVNTEYTAESTSYIITLSYIDNNSESNPIKTISLEGDFPYRTIENIETKGSPINGIKYYEKGGYIKKLDNEYCTAFAGYNSANEIKEITIDSFLINNNSISNRLGSGIRFFISWDGKDAKTREDLYTIRALSCKLASSRQNEYSFTLYDSKYKGTFEEFKEFIFDEVIGDAKSLSVDNVINSLLENKYINVHLDKDGNPWSNKTCNCNDQATGSVTFDINTDSLKGDFKLDTEVSNIAAMFSYDIAIFYPLISEYYNNKIYFVGDNNITLKKKIVSKIAIQIFNDYNKEYTKFVTSKNSEAGIALTDYTINSIDIYLPLNYKFIYSCNSNNQAQIYNSVSDISVEYTADLKGEIYKILQGENSEQIMICSISDSLYIDDKFNVYCFSVTYSKDNIVDDVNISKKFTLPYIDANGYWCINDIPTSIYARGKDGGQPSIIMTYTDTSTYKPTNEILSSFRQDELKNLKWEPTKVRIRPLDDNDNLQASTYHILNTYMPTNIDSLNENLITFLEHAIILNINSVHSENIEESTVSYSDSLAYGLGDNCVIPTFWVLNKVQDEKALGTENSQYKYEFAYVKQPKEAWAVDMNYLSNAEGIVKHYMNLGIEPDNYEHSWLVFDKIKTSFKNSSKDNNLAVWPVFLNQTRENYSNILGQSGGESIRYNNDLNMTLGFFDNVTKVNNTGYINGVGQKEDSPKYFSVDTDSKIKQVINYTYYPKEFIPNAKVTGNETSSFGDLVPFLDLSEVFVRNQSTFNRQNILAVDKDKNIFNAYIGTAFDLDDKSILHIGSSKVNPNIGEKTLMSKGDKSNFAKMNQIDIDFDKIYLNGNVITKGSSWTLYTGNDGNNKAWHMTTPIGYIGNLFDATDINQEDIISYTINTLMYNKTVNIMPEVSLPGGDIIPAHNENISYLNLNYFFEHVASVDGYTSYNCEFRGDFVQYINNCYFLQLQTDIAESYILDKNKQETSYEYLTTNPIEFSYTNDYKDNEYKGKMIVNVREIVSSTSQPIMYTNGNINNLH